MTEQPKEYIITGEQAEEYAKLYAEANTADFAKMAEVFRVANDFLKQIHSRPVSTPPERAALEPDYSRHNPRIELRKVCEQEAHDAVIRQDEREEVLDKLYAFVDNGCNHVECGHQYYVILPELIYLLNSLRQPTQKKEGAP
jgi:hypothetical protein